MMMSHVNCIKLVGAKKKFWVGLAQAFDVQTDWVYVNKCVWVAFWGWGSGGMLFSFILIHK